MERLDKMIAVAFQKTRTQAKQAILAGMVTVNGVPCKNVAEKVEPKAEIALNGKTSHYTEYSYIVMNKPSGVLSAATDKRQKTVLDLLPPELKRHGLFPVGRLDKTTTGLLLITNDGDFAHRALSPAKKVPKLYIVEVDAPITEEVVQGFAAGVTLADGTKLSPAVLKLLEPCKAQVEITEGKYHQIKRMFGTFHLGVNALERIRFAGFMLPDDLKPGESRLLTENEWHCIKNTIFS